MRPTAPGKCATHSATMTIQSMPTPIRRHSGASKPNGMARRASSPAGIETAEITGMAKRFAISP